MVQALYLCGQDGASLWIGEVDGCSTDPAKKSVEVDGKPEPIPWSPRCLDRDPQIPESFSAYNQAWGPHPLSEIRGQE